MCEEKHAACGSCASVFGVPKNGCVWAKGDRTAQGTSSAPHRVMRVSMSSMMPDEGPASTTGDGETMKGGVPLVKGAAWDNARTDTTYAYGGLPSAEVVLVRLAKPHVVRVFFDRVPLVTNMISRKQFMSNVERPRTSSLHPSAALLHAILAITARYLPKHLLSTWAYRPAQPHAGYYLAHQQTPLYHFQTFHRDTAVALLPATMHKATYRSADLVTAHILINVLNYWSGEEIKAMAGAAMVTRSLVHMGFHEPDDARDDAWEGWSKERPGGTQDPLERALRCRAWWMAWLVDKHVSFLNNSPSSIPDEDVYVELPTCHHDFVKGNAGVQKGVQTLRSPDVYFENPPLHQDGFNMLIKATALFSEASSFLREYARQSDTEVPYMKQKRLWEMIAKIDGFWQAFPPRLKDPTALDKMDRDLIAAMWTLFAVQVILGEPAIPGDWQGQLAKLCLDAIDNAFALFLKIQGTSFDAALFHAGIYQMAFHSARALIRFTDAAVDAGDHAAAERFSGLAQMIRHAMQENGTQNRLGVVLHAQLDDILRLQAEMANLKRLLASQSAMVPS